MKFIAFLLLAGSAFAFIAAQNWQIADGYNIAFSSDDAGGIFKGSRQHRLRRTKSGRIEIRCGDRRIHYQHR